MEMDGRNGWICTCVTNVHCSAVVWESWGIPDSITTYFPYFQLGVYCHCKMPETCGDMVECEECEEWYHIRCVNAKTTAKWLCKYYVESGHSR